MDNQEKIIVAFECPNCHQQKKLRKAPELRVGKMKCPNCQAPLKIVFNTDSDPQTATATILHTEADKSSEQSARPADNNSAKKKTVYGAEPPAPQSQGPVPFSPSTPDSSISSAHGHTTYAPAPESQGAHPVKNKTVMAGSMVEQQPMLDRAVYLNRLGKRGKVTEKYRIYEGPIIIGRRDPVEVSDIMYDKDPEMSRRSVQLTVIPTKQGIVLRLKVLKATNPVMVGSRTIVCGEEIAVNFDEIIYLGHSRLSVTLY